MRILTALVTTLCATSGPARADDPGGLGEYYRAMSHAFPSLVGEAELAHCDETAAIPPSDIATAGVKAAASGDLATARQCAVLLLDAPSSVGGALFFPWRGDYPQEPVPPAGSWVSGLTQGLALELFALLARKTGEPQYATAAAQVFASYQVAIEDGGFAQTSSDGTVSFEQYPPGGYTHVLSGGLIATLALGDYVSATGDKAARALWDKAVRWWEQNISRYDVVSPRFTLPASASSLDAVRATVLFRILPAAGPVDVYGLSFSSPTVDLKINVGGQDDTDPTQPAYLLYDHRYMDWSAPRATPDGRQFRSVIPASGEYDHAPFVLRTTDHVGEHVLAGLRMGFEYSAASPAAVQVYDGVEYIGIGTLPATEGQAASATLAVPEAVSGAVDDATQNRVDTNLLDDSARLLGLLADATQSDALRSYAVRWSKDARYVSFESLGVRPLPFLIDDAPAPVVAVAPPPSEESLHVEYPTVFSRGGQRVMLYAAFGDDRRWRIKEAVSADGRAWTRYGNLFDEKKLPFSGNYAFPFVTVADSATGPYVLYFAVQPAGGSYTGLWQSRSEDGVHWSPPRILLEDNLILDPVVIHRDDGEAVIYTSTGEDGPQIKMAIFNADGRATAPPRTLYVPNVGSKVEVGLYTLGVLRLGEASVVIAESGLPDRVDWTALCFGPADTLKLAAVDPLASFSRRGQRWDTLKYGQFFFTAGSRVEGYFNGITGSGAESGGQIGHAEVNLQDLSKAVAAADCR